MGNNFQHAPIFLEFSESDNSIRWCLQGQQTWELFLRLILIAPVYLQIMHFFGNNCFSTSPDLCILMVLLNIDVPSPLDFFLAMFGPIVNFCYIQYAHHVYLNQNMVLYDLPCSSYTYSTPSWHLASLFWFKMWNLCWLSGIILNVLFKCGYEMALCL